ncbi:hypothetical protein H1D32_07500 [Anaerobacillus sp. CMMVII]|uniref:hypothetical protein n=1 Tax=Anaerobacillus sp. CMMVII TaxID=2755588 RepID=UPI0021B8188E|nr:hypothetical protein [Anaerobacillus sp. CMMVII]MCT8137606.1 hypothetical protein [Anaerobacillus sp. CMMVII]
MFDVNIIEVFGTIFSWGLVIFLIYYYYQKQEIKPKIWKAIIATLIGLFVFSFNFPVLGTIFKIPILPLGVWILLWYASSRGSWGKYRRFAWLGFFANFIFLATTILTVLLHHAVYPKSDLATFVASYEDAAILPLHPSAKEVTLDNELQHLLTTFVEEPINSVEWYNGMFEVEPNEREEQFPYYLSGTSSKWGSGIPKMIYVEKDGKGILIDSSEKQRYFRSTQSLLKGGNE